MLVRTFSVPNPPTMFIAESNFVSGAKLGPAPG